MLGVVFLLACTGAAQRIWELCTITKRVSIIHSVLTYTTLVQYSEELERVNSATDRSSFLFTSISHYYDQVFK